MLASSKDDLEKILSEAEQIKAGVDPATATGETAEPSPATSGGGQEGAAGQPAAPSPSFEQLAELACMLCDWPFVRAFGAVGQLPEPFRTEARNAWAAAAEKYLPKMLENAGPFTILASIYFTHGGALFLSWRMNAPAAPSSGKEAPANQP